MALAHSTIRSDFVADYLTRRAAVQTAQWDAIHARDELEREINRRFGYKEEDGTYSASIRSHIDAPYVAEFERVEAKFQEHYDGLSARNRAIDLARGMTVYEYLLLEDVMDKDRLLEAAADPGYYDWIGLKARIEIDKIKHNTFSDMKHILARKKEAYGYAGKRCRKVLVIKPWDLPAQAAIGSFLTSLDRQMNTMLLGLTGK